MRIALFGARANNRGLGNVTWEFFKNVRPEFTCVVFLDGDREDLISRFRGETSYGIPNIPYVIDGVPTNEQIDHWLLVTQPEVIFCAEVPYNYYLFEAAKKKGIKTVLQYNYEFLDYLHHPEYPFPDVLLAPSKWHIKDVSSAFGHLTRVEYLSNPVNREVLPFKQKKRGKRFIHVAGAIDLWEDRNGTQTLIDSLPYITEKIYLTIYCGSQAVLEKYFPVGGVTHYPGNVKLDVKLIELENYWELYQNADVFVSPRKYGGQSLPLNECISAGIIPIMPNVGPQNQFLHPMMLTPVCGKKWLSGKAEIDAYTVNPESLASHIDIIARLNKDQIAELSKYSDMLADLISWNNLLPKYLKLFIEIARENATSDTKA